MPLRVYPQKVSWSFIKNYCYLVVDHEAKEALLIDPAWELNKIESKLQETETRCTTILLTHAHIDHVHLAERLVKKYEAQVMMSKVEIDYYHFRCPGLIALEESSVVLFGSTEINSILTPGHTKGSMCFWIENKLFTGDTLFTEGCGICVGKGADPENMFHSLQQLKEMIPLETLIYPGHSFGHRPGKRFSHLLKNNLYLHFQNIDEFVAYRMRKGQTGWFNFR
ncbi:MAG: MBL fold metallo-hydrolase [Kiritimatiellae bacterium]|nr:MBL fold metallo-hydrolase [Kiritimatiellia bacterium]